MLWKAGKRAGDVGSWGGEINFSFLFADPEKISTFAARIGGRNGGEKKGGKSLRKRMIIPKFKTPKDGEKKIKTFLFADPKNFPTFAIPKRRGTRKARCRKGNNKD